MTVRSQGKIPEGRRVWPVYAVVGLGALYIYDTFNASAIQRTFRTGYNGAIIALDYKLSFTPGHEAKIEAMHERIARRMLNTIKKNGGLYIKLGQSLAIQAAILPKPYSEGFGQLFDEAPQVSYAQVEKVFMQEFGLKPDEVFDNFDHKALHAASVGQVHKAQLKRTKAIRNGKLVEEGGDWVAVKVQKPDIKKQMEWDLFAYRALLWTYERIFKIPMYWTVDFTTQQLRLEADFENEARNAMKTRQLIQGDSNLRDVVSVPKVFWDYTGKRIMTAEWVDGATKLNDKAGIEEMGLSVPHVAKTAVELFATQMFRFGQLHADPSPGNVLVRRKPGGSPGQHEIVLIDHGLYVNLSEQFRHQYALFWKSIFLNDTRTMKRIASDWGVRHVDFFASATLLRPYQSKERKAELKQLQAQDKSAYQAQVDIKEQLQNFLEDTQKIPQELVFIARNMRMVQSSVQLLGSPVNRISIMAHIAVRSLGDDWTFWDNRRGTPLQRRQSPLLRLIGTRLNYWRFLFTLWVIDLGFYFIRLRQWFTGRTEDGFENILERQIKESAEKQFGIHLNDAAFQG